MPRTPEYLSSYWRKNQPVLIAQTGSSYFKAMRHCEDTRRPREICKLRAGSSEYSLNCPLEIILLIKDRKLGKILM